MKDEKRLLAHAKKQRQQMPDAERERIARDVHDVLGHSLTIVNLKAELAAKLVETNAPAAQEPLPARRGRFCRQFPGMGC